MIELTNPMEYVHYCFGVGILCFFPACLVLFTIWGIKAASLVGKAEDDVWRCSDSIKGGLLWFATSNWIAYWSYVLTTQADVLVAIVLTLYFLFLLLGPPALIVSYFYTRLLESRTEEKVVDYLVRKENLDKRSLIVTVGN